MTVLSTFLESSLNFLSNGIKKHFKVTYSQGEKRCQNLTCQKDKLTKKRFRHPIRGLLEPMTSLPFTPSSAQTVKATTLSGHIF